MIGPCQSTPISIRIEGVVDCACRVGARDGGWQLRVLLRPWSQNGEKPIRTLLYVDFPQIQDKAAARAELKWSEGIPVAVAVSGLRKPGKNDCGWHAKAAGSLRRCAPSDALGKLIKKQQLPRHVVDPILGRLTLNRAMDWYEGMRKFRRNEYEIAVITPDPDDAKKVAQAVKLAAKCIRRVDDELVKIRNQIADSLLQTYNTEWRQNGRALSRSGFVKRLSLSSVIVQAGRTTVYFTADELFIDHGVEVRLTARGRISEVLVA